MKLVASHTALEHDIGRRFAAFQRQSSQAYGRRYPEPLKTLIREAHDAGLSLATLRALSGVSPTVLERWLKEKPEAKVRCLSVVPVATSHSRPVIIIRLSNGTTLEFASGDALRSEILTWLSPSPTKEV